MTESFLKSIWMVIFDVKNWSILLCKCHSEVRDMRWPLRFGRDRSLISRGCKTLVTMGEWITRRAASLLMLGEARYTCGSDHRFMIQIFAHLVEQLCHVPYSIVYVIHPSSGDSCSHFILVSMCSIIWAELHFASIIHTGHFQFYVWHVSNGLHISRTMLYTLIWPGMTG